MNLAELKALKNTPKDKVRETINNLNLSDLHTNRGLRRRIKRIQKGAKFYPRDFVEIIDGLMMETAKARYCDEDGEPKYNSTIVDALAARDVTGQEIPGYIKSMPEWQEAVEMGLTE